MPITNLRQQAMEWALNRPPNAPVRRILATPAGARILNWQPGARFNAYLTFALTGSPSATPNHTMRKAAAQSLYE
jgi:hypothetical protein